MRVKMKTLSEIEEGVKKAFEHSGITKIVPSRDHNSVRYRMCIVYIARENLHKYYDIAEYLDKDHSTCIYLYKRCVDALKLKTYPELTDLLFKSIAECYQKNN